MPVPTASDLHVNTLLSNLSIQYTQDREGFIADRACPTCPVDKQTDIYPVWSKADFFRMQAQKRADEDKLPVAALGLDVSNSYHCDRYGLKKLVLATERRNSDIDIDQAVVSFLTEQILIALDYKVVSKLLTYTNWTTSYDGVSAGPTGAQFLQWNDSSSNPFQNVRTINTALKKSCGRRATTLLVTSDIDDVLKEHSDILDKVKYTQTGIATNDLLAAAFGVKNYLVADAVYNSAAEAATASLAFMATKTAVLYFTADSPSKDTPSACYNFSWSEFDQVPSGKGATVRSWPEEDPVGEWMAAQMHFAPKITAADAGICLKTVIA